MDGGPSFYQNMLRAMTGVDFSDGEVTEARIEALEPGFDMFNENAEHYVITAGNADSIIRVSDGELWMVPAWEDHLAGLQKRGEVRGDIAFYIPEMGMNGGGNGVAIPLNAPHPAAALVFMNWLTSAETQTMFNSTFGTAPMNTAADDSAALVPNEQRAFSTVWGAQPFRGAVEEAFIDAVILAPEVLKRLVFGREVTAVTVMQLSECAGLPWHEQADVVFGGGKDSGYQTKVGCASFLSGREPAIDHAQH